MQELNSCKIFNRVYDFNHTYKPPSKGNIKKTPSWSKNGPAPLHIMEAWMGKSWSSSVYEGMSWYHEGTENSSSGGQLWRVLHSFLLFDVICLDSQSIDFAPQNSDKSLQPAGTKKYTFKYYVSH